MSDQYYIFSLPERSLKAGLTIGGGAVLEITRVILPNFVRKSKLYQASVDRLLRIIVEVFGEVENIYEKDGITGNELLVRKSFGNILEIGSILTLGWSPVWFFAMASDITGGTKEFLDTLVLHLKKENLILPSQSVNSVTELLTTLEKTSGILSDNADLPPINVEQMKKTFESLKANHNHLPSNKAIDQKFDELQKTAKQEQKNIWEISTLLAIGAKKTGIGLSQKYIFDYYSQSFEKIQKIGLLKYMQTTFKPYLVAIKKHFKPTQKTFTEKLLQKIINSKN